MGQIASGFLSIADARDVVANLAHGDYAFAGLNALGFIPVIGDTSKTTSTVGKFILRNIDDVPKVTVLLEFLSKNFPIADRLIADERILVSTKSLDIAAQSYQSSSRLKSVLNKYADALQNFEKNYFDADGAFEWGNMKLSTSQYDKKVLEIILPDTIITENSLNILKEFKKTMEDAGIEVWYCVAK